MDNTYPNPESDNNNLQVETKVVLFRLAVFVFVLFATHALLMWLHPFGARKFFLNLALGGLSALMVLRLVLPRLKQKLRLNIITDFVNKPRFSGDSDEMKHRGASPRIFL